MDVVGKFTGDIRHNMKLLRQLREDSSYSQSQLAKKSGICVDTVKRLEIFQRNPLVITAARLCDAMGYDILVVRRPSEE